MKGETVIRLSLSLLFLVACGEVAIDAPSRVNFIDGYGDYPVAREVANGALVFQVREDDRWVEAARLSFDEFFREKTVRLGRAAREVRIVRDGGHAAHIDAIELGHGSPLGGYAAELAHRDFDVIALPTEPLVLAFDGPRDALLKLTARVEGSDVCTNPFRFPTANTDELQEGSHFYTYTLDAVRGRLTVDGQLDEVAGEDPFFRGYAHAQTGHPSNDVYGWVRNDDATLFVAIDFTGDNTMDGDADYARVVVNTRHGLRTFTVTASENTWGVPGFVYTDRVSYRHKVYEVAIPLAELGIDAAETEPLQLAFVTYGTCASCGCTDPEVEDPGGDCCLPADMDTAGYCCMAGDGVDPDGLCCPPADMDAGGFCCEYGVTGGMCDPPPSVEGPVFSLKILYYSGNFEHVTQVNNNPEPNWVGAVGWSGFGGGPNVDAAVYRNVGGSADGDRVYLPTFDDYANFVPSRAVAINDRGETVGWRIPSAGAQRLAISILTTSSNGVPHDPDMPNTFSHGLSNYAPNLLPMAEIAEGSVLSSWATGINNQTPPQIVGAASNADQVHAFLAQGSGYTALPHLLGSDHSQAAAINDQGQVVGCSLVATAIQYPCDDGYGGTTTCSGEIDVYHPVIWESGVAHDLGLACHTCDAWAHDINENGWIIGQTRVPGTTKRFNFVYIPEGETPPTGLRVGMNILGLGPVFGLSNPGHFSGFFREAAINNHNQIVGGIDGMAFLWLPAPAYNLDAGLYLLADLIPTINGGAYDGMSTHELEWAVDISDTGHILAKAIRRDPLPATQSRYYVDLFPTGYVPYGGNPPPSISDPFVVLPPPEDIEETVEDGDPVNTFTGELTLREEADLAVGRLRFARFYSSGIEQRIPATTWPFGAGWRHNYMWSLQLDDSGLVPAVTVVDPEGRKIELEHPGSAWVPLDAARAGTTLAELASTFELRLPRSGLVLTFDSTTGALLEIDNTAGFVRSLTYTGSLLTTITDSFGQTLTLTWSGDQIVSLTDGRRTVDYAFDAAGDLQYVTNAAGHVSEYAYDIDNHMTAKTLPELNAPLTHTWDAGRVVAQTDADGNQREIHYGYQGIVGDTGLVDPLGNTRLHHYNSAAELIGRTDAEGNTTTYSYDADGVRFATVDALGRETVYQYDPSSGKPALKNDAYSGQWSYEYTPDDVDGTTVWDRTRVTYPDGTFETAAFDRQATTNTVTLIDRAGGVTTSVYDEHGLLTSNVNRAGGLTTRSYTAAGRLAGITNPAGETTLFDYAYVGTNEVRTVTRPGGALVVRTLDAMGNLLNREEIPAGVDPSRITSYTYDGNGNLLTTTNPAGYTASFTYDTADRLVSFTDATGGLHQTEYDEADRVARVIDANGVAYLYSYDGNGRVIGQTDPHGEEWTTEYDAIGRTLARTSPLGHRADFEYFDSERRAVVTDALGRTVESTEDALGRVTQREDQLGRLTCFTYDPRGLLASATLPSAALTTPCVARTELAPDQAVTATFAWDAMGQVSRIVDPNGQLWELRYDDSGRLQFTEDPLSRTTEYQYNSDGHLQWVLYPDGGTQEIVSDAYGQPARRVFTLPGEPNEVFDFTYDAMGYAIAINDETYAYDANGVITNSNGLAVANDAGGRVETVTVAPGKVITYTYDLDRLAAIDDWAGGGVTFAYDADGRLTSVTRTNGVATTYAYDANGQLTDIVDGTLGENHLTYSADGRVSHIDRDLPALPAPTAAASTSRTVDAASQLEGFTYDARGRVEQDSQRTYAWSPAGRLASHTGGGNTVSLTHDSSGNLIEHAAGGVTTTYRWSYAHTIACPVERTTGGESTYYVCTPEGEIVYAIRADDDGRDWFHFDEAGNTRFLSDDAGRVTAGWGYLPYGEIAASFGVADHPFTFSGRFGVIQDGDLFHMRKRVYDSRTHRFLSRDPIQMQMHPLLLNPYQYAMGDPLGYVDPLGATPTQTYTGSVADNVVGSTLNANGWGNYLTKKGADRIFTSALAEATTLRKYAPSSISKVSRLDQLWKQIEISERVSSRADTMGSVGDRIGQVAETVKAIEKANSIHAETLSCQDRALQLHSDRMDAIREGVKAGTMSGESAEAAVLNGTAEFNATLESCEASGLIEHAILFFETLENLVTGWLPPPAAAAVDTAKSTIPQLGFSNPFVSKAFGDSFYSAAAGE